MAQPEKHPDGLILGPDRLWRCWWVGDDPLYRHYHDTEWGRPVHDDVRLFEKMSLEGFQAGLSWITILKKRENFRAAFTGFDLNAVAKFTAADIERLMNNNGIVRHRGKIEAVINNARQIPNIIQEYGSFSAYLWAFSSKTTPNIPKKVSDIPTQTENSRALSRDLKKRGFKFVGPTTMYALMQAMGMVNDHIAGCCCRHHN